MSLNTDPAALKNVPAVTTLRLLTQALTSPLLQILAAPGGLDRRVRTTVLYDAVDLLPSEPDAILLLSGVRADDPRTVTTVQRASELGYCAVVVKQRAENLSTLITDSLSAGIALLSLADEVPWRHFDGLVASVLASQGVGGESASGVGDELFSLANTIASRVGGSVAIEDLDRRILAYSSIAHQRIDAVREQGILDRRVPDLARDTDQYRSVLAGSGVVRFSQRTDELPRAAIAIKAGERPLGTIWAIESESGLTVDGERMLIEASQLAAVAILRAQNASGLEPQLHETVLLGALEGSLTGVEAASRLSLPGGGELGLLGFALAARQQEPAPLITHVASVVARYIAAYRADAAMATTSTTIYVLLPSGGAGAADRFADGTSTAVQRSFPQQICVSIARSSTDVSNLPTMRREVDDILRVTTQQRDLPRVARLTDVHTRVVLTRLADEFAQEPRLRHPGVDALIAHDAEHRTDYAVSLGAWFDAVGDIAAAAKAVGVHPNTLRYRLRRVDELFGLNLSHPDDRLSIWLQLRLLRSSS